MGTGSQQWKGTLTHFFFRLLHDKGMLRRLYVHLFHHVASFLNVAYLRMVWRGNFRLFANFFACLVPLPNRYTQNIDGLDLQAGIPDDLVISVHGSMGKIQCESCAAFEDYPRFKEQVGPAAPSAHRECCLSIVQLHFISALCECCLRFGWRTWNGTAVKKY